MISIIYAVKRILPLYSLAISIMVLSAISEAQSPGHVRGDFTRMQGMIAHGPSVNVEQNSNTGAELISYQRFSFSTIQLKTKLSSHDLVQFRFNVARSGPDFALFQGSAYFPRLRKRVAASADLGSDHKLHLRVLEVARNGLKGPIDIEVDSSDIDAHGEAQILRHGKISQDDFACGVKDAIKNNYSLNSKKAHTKASSYKSVDIYAQGDSVFHQSVSNPARTLSSVFNDAEVLYARDLGLIFNLTLDISPRTLLQPVGYDSNFEVTTFNELRADLASRSEDLVFLLVGTKPQNFVGIANQIGAVCGTPSKHYALSYYYDGAYLTVAHEMGHLFGAEHYNVSPQGIMAGGADAQLEVVKFVDYSKQQIASYIANNSSCLDTAGSTSDYGSISAQFTSGADVTLSVTRFGSPFANVAVKGEYRTDANSEWLYYDKFTTGDDGKVTLTIPSPGQYIYSFYADDYSFVKSNILTYSGDGPVTDPTDTPGSSDYFLSARLAYKSHRATLKASISDSNAIGISGVTCDLYFRKRASADFQFLGSYQTNGAGTISVTPRKLGQYVFYAQNDATVSSSIVTVRKLRK